MDGGTNNNSNKYNIIVLKKGCFFYSFDYSNTVYLHQNNNKWKHPIVLWNKEMCNNRICMLKYGCYRQKRKRYPKSQIVGSWEKELELGYGESQKSECFWGLTWRSDALSV